MEAKGQTEFWRFCQHNIQAVRCGFISYLPTMRVMFLEGMDDPVPSPHDIVENGINALVCRSPLFMRYVELAHSRIPEDKDRTIRSVLHTILERGRKELA